MKEGGHSKHWFAKMGRRRKKLKTTALYGSNVYKFKTV